MAAGVAGTGVVGNGGAAAAEPWTRAADCAVATDHWAALAAAVAGSRKAKGGAATPSGGCDDSVALEHWQRGRSAWLIAACADGAGSASAGAVGSRVAVVAAVAACRSALENRRQLGSGLSRGLDGASVVQAAKQAVVAAAESMQLPVRELATTLTCVVAGPSWTWIVQVGDGAAALWPQRALPGHWQIAIWPARGEYANSTHFLSDETVQWSQRTMARAGALALVTDGLLPLGLDLARQEAFSPFFEGLSAELRRTEPAQLLAPLQAFLASPRVAERTDDDVSLILAVRRSPLPRGAGGRGDGHAAA